MLNFVLFFFYAYLICRTIVYNCIMFTHNLGNVFSILNKLLNCVINNMPLDHVIFGTFLEPIYLLSLYIYIFFFFYTYVYLYVYYVL